MQSNFLFLKSDLSTLFDNARGAERKAVADPRAACVYARVALESTVKWMYQNDEELQMPFGNPTLNELLKDRDFREGVPSHIMNSCEVIRKNGNAAAHQIQPIPSRSSLDSLRELHNLLYWVYRIYFESDIESVFDSTLIPTGKGAATRKAQILDLQKKLADKAEAEREKEAKQLELEQEIETLRKKLAENKKEAHAKPDTHDYSEAQTRKSLIDIYLREAGWLVESADVTTEMELSGVRRNLERTGMGYADYVLFGDDGKPLAVIEAKKTTVDAEQGKYQAEDYANALEKQYGQRPIIFYTNGYRHFLWDDTFYPPREVQGFYKKEELQLLIHRRTSRKTLTEIPVNTAVAGRSYQKLAIQAVDEHFEKGHRKALIVMATGTGKTRTTIALVEQLQKANWAKRVLFLCDRDSLVYQANKAFKEHLPNTPAVDLRDDKTDTTSRICMSTYATMMGLIDTTEDGKKCFGAGHFDLIVLDEAHRSVYHKYKAIFAYFDALLVGLTATPRSEADKNTYELFALKKGKPVYYYELDEAVAQKFLVDYQAIRVSSSLSREGLHYKDLSDEEKLEYEQHFFDEETGDIPDKIQKEALNKWLFNIDTVDSFLKNLMEQGIKVEGGDKLGKTIIFAKNRDHAKFIVERFDENYPHYKGHFATRIDYSLGKDAKGKIEDFGDKKKMPQIAVSVDMLDTGIDVPEAVNLVFAKPVYSKTKFWQMIGRGTRLCENLFGPGDHKQGFLIFDYCNNFEFFEMNPEGREGGTVEPISKKIFLERLELVTRLSKEGDKKNRTIKDLSIGFLHDYTSQMNRDNFIVRPRLEQVNKYQKRDAWDHLTPEKVTEITKFIAGLPSEMDLDDEDARRWDLLLLQTQVDLLDLSSDYPKRMQKIRRSAAHLIEKVTIPEVKSNIELIEAIQEEGFWEEMDLETLEKIRDKLRLLIKFIDKGEKKIVYTDFDDEVDDTSVFEGNMGYGSDMTQYRKKMEALIRENDSHITIQKIRHNQQITESDLKELEKMLFDGETEQKEQFNTIFAQRVQEKTHVENPPLSLLIRSIVGMDQADVETVFSDFIDQTRFNTAQLAFVNQLIQFFVKDGYVPTDLLYESPFSDIHDGGPDELFPERADHLFDLIEDLNQKAII